jgi:uncharacterized protein (TIGR02594 family)
MALPHTYAWLEKEPGPKMLKEALALYGVREKAGGANNPTILGWARETGIKDYRADKIPWCGLLMAVVAKRAGYRIPEEPLWARNWGLFGEKVRLPELGDTLVFSRGSGGHVGLYVGHDRFCFHVLGGNQGDAVSIVRILRIRLLAARRPDWQIGEPTNRRRILLSASGVVSKNEV